MKQMGVNIVVINFSFGGYYFDEELPPIEKEAIDAAGEIGIIFVAAAGNGGFNNDLSPPDDPYPPNYPSSYDSFNIISVAATELYDQLHPFSNYGLTSVDLAAPGDLVLNTTSYDSYMPGMNPENDRFYDDMEIATDNWLPPLGEWAITTENPFMGEKSWSDSPDGPYKGYSYSVLTSNTIDLEGASEPLWLVFATLFELEEWDDWLDISIKGLKRSLWERTTEKAHESTYAWSDSPGGEYPNNAESWLIGPSIDLSGAAYTVNLSFWLTGQIEEYYNDVLLIYFSTDNGETWDCYDSITGDHSEGWERFSIPIPYSLRTKNFRFALVSWSDFSITFDGFYIDDITVSDRRTVYFRDDMEEEQSWWSRPTMESWNYQGSVTGSSMGMWGQFVIPLNESYFWNGFQMQFELVAWCDNPNACDGVYIDTVGIGTPEFVQTYEYWGGTSMAAAHETGAVALVAAHYPFDTTEARINRILSGADLLPSLERMIATGGRLNLYNAIKEPPPKEQIENILQFVDESVENGTLEGRGCIRLVAQIRLKIFTQMLEQAKSFIDRGLTRPACSLLLHAHLWCDGDPSPPDFVEGEATPRLAWMIQFLRRSLECKCQGKEDFF